MVSLKISPMVTPCVLLLKILYLNRRSQRGVEGEEAKVGGPRPDSPTGRFQKLRVNSRELRLSQPSFSFNPQSFQPRAVHLSDHAEFLEPVLRNDYRCLPAGVVPCIEIWIPVIRLLDQGSDPALLQFP